MVALSSHVSRLNGVVFPINCTVSLQVTNIYSYLTSQQLGEVGRVGRSVFLIFILWIEN